MKLEDQVCSLELAKELKELGVKQESLFVWVYLDQNCYSIKFYPYSIIPDENSTVKIFSAFTVAELGKMIPFIIKVYKYHNFEWPKGKTFYCEQHVGYTKHNYSPSVMYHYYIYDDEEECNPVDMIVGPDFSDNNEANSRAMMLIWLIKNGYVNASLSESN